MDQRLHFRMPEEPPDEIMLGTEKMSQPPFPKDDPRFPGGREVKRGVPAHLPKDWNSKTYTEANRFDPLNQDDDKGKGKGKAQTQIGRAHV